ncbi:MAG: BatD family protein [Candidatus Omnitrophota bacterium]|nr:BatD family protein [Candidatus Omnitrophota bacterium]
MKKTFLIFLVIFLIAAVNVWAQVKLEAKLEQNKVYAGNPIYLYLTFRGTQDVERPEVSPVDGLKIKYVGPSSEVSIINGVVSRSITFTYLVIPLKGGQFEIGPFFAEYQGQMFKADPVILNSSVTPGPLTGPKPAYVPPDRDEPQASPPYVDDKIFLTMDIDRRVVYVNEVVPLTIRVYVDGMGLRDIEYPNYPHEGFSTGELAEPERRTELVKGVNYNVLVFKQDLFGIKEGDYVLGPGKLNCKMVVRRQPTRRFRSSLFGITIGDDDFFSSRFGYKTYPIELESNEIPVTILPFPEEDRPEDFRGTVGDFALDVNITPKKVKVGDPVTMRMAIRGRGNIDTVTAPHLLKTDDENIKTYEPQVTKKKNKKIYEQIFIPKNDKVKELPAVSFSFFNPRTRKYETLRKGPFPIKVMAQPESERVVKMVSMPGEAQVFYPQEKLGKDIIHIKENIGNLRPRGRVLYGNWLFMTAQLVPLALFAFFYTGYRKKERILTDKSYARFLKAPKKAKVGLAKAKTLLKKKEVMPFYDAVFKTLQEYLANRFNLPLGSITCRVIEEKLRPAGCDEKILEMLRDVFSRCEMARYASSVPGGHEAEETMEKIKRVIDYLEKFKSQV